MPARDPAASPSHPTLSHHISITNHHGPGSPSSSGYSFASLVSPTNTSSTPNVPIQQQIPPTGVPTNGYGTMGASSRGVGTGGGGGVRRKLSLNTERQMAQGQGNTGTAQPPGNNTGLGVGRRGSMAKRKPSLDWAEDLPSAAESSFSAVSGTSSANAIRDSSNRLASLSATYTRPRRISVSSNNAPPPPPPPQLEHRTSVPHPKQAQGQSLSSAGSQSRQSIDNNAYRPIQPSHLQQSNFLPDSQEVSPGSEIPSSVGHVGPSGLSVMLERDEERKRQQSQLDLVKAGQGSPGEGTDNEATPVSRPARLATSSYNSESTERTSPNRSKDHLPITVEGEVSNMGDEDEAHASSALRRYLADGTDLERADEATPLLSSGHKSGPTPGNGLVATVNDWKQQAGKITMRDVARVAFEPVTLLPATILGLLLNVLDGVSYGMILFPANPVFQDFGSLGVSMFFVSCIVSQLVFSLGGSIFPGGNGSMMIEAVPFFHILVNIIQSELGDDSAAIVSTTMVCFAFSSILTGAVFFTLGAFRLGSLVGYFPRHILVGCIGGVGIFLIETGLEVSFGLKDEGFEYNFQTLKMFFASTHAIALWLIPFTLALALRVITHFFHHQLIFPAYFFLIPCIFYIVVAIGGWDLEHLRHTGWIFDVGGEAQPWYQFYTHFDFKKTSWTAFWAAMPTQLALVFFGILHVPLNVPALGVSLGEDNVKLDRELVAHGFSNLASGLVGSVPNYLCYVNTVLFYRVGGGSRLSGLMLAAATGAVLMIGPTVISYLPVMVVGALIFVLGLDLTVEAVWDTRNRVNKMEYITIWAIAIGMTVWDFVIGLLFGIILACIFFVVQSSRRRAIRTVFNGSTAKSTVRRPRSQRAFIQQVGTQTYVMKLQGFLFFGTISAVEDEIRKLLDLATWSHDPIRFLIIDLHLVHGLDFSSAEAFVRVQRILAAKDVLLILCGAKEGGVLESALRAVDLWPGLGEDGRLEVFAGLNEALEWTENAYLTAFYENQQEDREAEAAKIIDFPKVDKPPFTLNESFVNSPRRSHLAKAGGDTLPRAFPAPPSPSPTAQEDAQPFPLLLQTLGPYLVTSTMTSSTTLSIPELSDDSYTFLSHLCSYFHQAQISANTVLWRQSDPADGLYLIESGSLRATYSYDNHTKEVQETMVAGTIAGDLSTLSGTCRNATTVAERDCVLWKMDLEGLEELEKDHPEVARRFTRIVLKVVAEEHDVLNSHLIAVLS